VAKRKSLQARRAPSWLFNELGRRFGPLVLDAYADKSNALCPNYLTKKKNGHVVPWVDGTFANPEFNEMLLAVRKAVAEGLEGNCSCVLGPVGCSQKWYREWAIRGTIWVPDCRINFDDPAGRPTGAGHKEPGADRDTIVMTFGPGHWIISGFFRCAC
jgi:hypothetical protein